MILVIDFGSQYTQLLARRIRELSIFSEIVPFPQGMNAIRKAKEQGNLKGIILSGGPHSVYEADAPTISKDVLEMEVPVLGVCYGLQLLNVLLGGEVRAAPNREYGPERILAVSDIPHVHPLMGSLPAGKDREVDVWMSHGDEIAVLAPELEISARSASGCIAAFHHRQRPIFGLQFHPEVQHTPRGFDMIRHFVLSTCGCRPNWTPGSIVESSVEAIRRQVDARGKDAQVICGLSGGVDSTVAAVLVSKAIGKRLHCIFVNNGCLRLNEFESVLEYLKELDLNVRGVDASDLFLERLQGVTDPEQKRKIIGHAFIEVFDREAHRIPGAQFLVQGTLYTDVIESVPLRGTSTTIKSHHNVGGLPEKMKLELIEPLRELFKDEVRVVGRELGIPADILGRHPFPGPGLAIRVPGEVTFERLEVLRKADSILIEELKKEGLYDKVWQAFAVLLPVRTVGVMGDGRTYENVCAIRCVDATDGMTAHWSRLPFDFLEKASARIINEVRGINRVVYDVSSKPPATIEWE